MRHRISRSDGFNMAFSCVFHGGDAPFTAALRTCQISRAPSDAMKKASGQTVSFPALADAPATSAKIKFAAQSSSGLPVEYFVLMGPGIIENGAFVPLEVPEGLSKLI